MTQILFLILGTCWAVTGLVAQQPSANEGAERRLLIHGGGHFPRQCKDEFAGLADTDRLLIVIPTATSDDNLPTLKQAKASWGELGFTRVKLLHTRDRDVANQESFLEPFDKAGAVWISGGDQSRLSRAYQGTEVERKLMELIDRGGVVGGSSAGAAIQSRVMIQGGRQEPEMGEGFDLLGNSIVDQHFLARSRLNRLIRAVESHPERTGVGIDEGTSLAVAGDQAKVIGSSYVVLVRMLDEKIDIRSFPADSEFILSDYGLSGLTTEKKR